MITSDYISVALVVGHHPLRQGASIKRNNKLYTEYLFNNSIAKLVKFEFDKMKYKVNINIIRRNTYKWLPQKINKTKADFCVSLHLNADLEPDNDNDIGTGTEALYHYQSKPGKKMGKLFSKIVSEKLHFRNRGAKKVEPGSRGYHILQKTRMPCIILESGFIDNKRDFDYLLKHEMDLIDAICTAILKTVDIIKNKE